MTVRLSSRLNDALLSEAEAAAPQECCGLLLGHEDAITAIRPVANVHPLPHTRFEIEPRALIDAHRAERAGGPALLGYYHSHPSGPAEPSATDRALAAPDNRLWAIIGRDGSGWSLRFWRATRHGFVALPSESVSG